MTAEYAVQDQASETQNRLLILGASTRAAAESACRADFLPVCGDMFGDDDLRKFAEVHTVADYPKGLIDVALRIPPSNWIYTGAMENCPKLVGRISQRHRLLGNPADVLNAVLDPFHIASILTAVNLPVLCVRNETHTGNAGGGEWLRKPRRSGGGRAIRFWNSELEDRPGSGEPFYLQEYVAGTPVSAVFLASRLNCRPVGITRQLVGEQELHATRFAYCGSLGPLRLPENLASPLIRARS
ncbi:MAG: ATP-grasp domain-containing protein [Planctomycetes bacterium]|nr:ATP-grasp domain-containing protein [Planctomycetota bacterium]